MEKCLRTFFARYVHLPHQGIILAEAMGKNTPFICAVVMRCAGSHEKMVKHLLDAVRADAKRNPALRPICEYIQEQGNVSTCLALLLESLAKVYTWQHWIMRVHHSMGAQTLLDSLLASISTLSTHNQIRIGENLVAQFRAMNANYFYDVEEFELTREGIIYLEDAIARIYDPLTQGMAKMQL